MLLTNEGSPPILVITILLSLLHAFLPNDKINKKLFKIEDPEPN